MICLLCRKRVKEYNSWRTIFDSHRQDQRKSGLHLVNLWREIDDPENVFFIFEVTDKEKALKFINDPESARMGELSGVIDGECHFVESEISGE